jgi:hypothetical protein
MDYKSYKALNEKMVLEKSTTGANISPMLVEYTVLNNRRMKRWDKTFKVDSTHKTIIQNFKGQTTWIVITEVWCGDAAHILPVLNKIASLNSGINLRIILRDDNLNFMDQFLTNGSRAIPKLIAINQDFEVTGLFGPRPKSAAKLVSDFKAKYGVVNAELKKELQLWYNKDKGQSISEELIELLKS